MTLPRAIAACSLALAAACDPYGRENARGPAVPDVAPPLLSRVEILPPKVDRSTTNRIVVKDPPAIDFTQVDQIKQADGIVDILWVIDDSGSMANQRQTLGGNFNRFFQELVKLQVDFQIGVTSTNSADSGRLRGTTKIIKNTTTNPSAVFTTNTTFPASRARWEQGLRMAQFALQAPNTAPGGPNDGFLRTNAALAIIVVSDEDDSSYGTTDYYARAFKAVKGKGNESLVTFSSISGLVPTGCTPPGEQIYFGSFAEPGFRYSAVATKTGGIVGSICDASFENTLVLIAQALNTLKRVFPLTLKPVAGTISVTVNGAPIAENPVSGWQYRADTNSVVFLGTYVPPPASIIRIEYAFVK